MLSDERNQECRAALLYSESPAGLLLSGYAPRWFRIFCIIAPMLALILLFFLGKA